jgi:hypothetical protein
MAADKIDEKAQFGGDLAAPRIVEAQGRFRWHPVCQKPGQPSFLDVRRYGLLR